MLFKEITIFPGRGQKGGPKIFIFRISFLPTLNIDEICTRICAKSVSIQGSLASLKISISFPKLKYVGNCPGVHAYPELSKSNRNTDDFQMSLAGFFQIDKCFSIL